MLKKVKKILHLWERLRLFYDIKVNENAGFHFINVGYNKTHNYSLRNT
jgi:hypothetical protein